MNHRCLATTQQPPEVRLGFLECSPNFCQFGVWVFQNLLGYPQNKSINYDNQAILPRPFGVSGNLWVGWFTVRGSDAEASLGECFEPRLRRRRSVRRLRNGETGGSKCVSMCWASNLFMYIFQPPGDRKFWSMFPLNRVPFGVPIFDPLPYILYMHIHIIWFTSLAEMGVITPEW